MAVQIESQQGILSLNALASVHQPNWAFNADANSCHAFGIFMAAIGTLRPSGCAAR